MFKVTLNPKNRKKYLTSDSGKLKALPNNWLSFAPLCKIRSGEGVINFNPYDYQINLIDKIEKYQTTIICKTRQLGITELVANWMLYRACTDNSFFGLVVSKGQSETSNIARRIRRMIESLYEYIEPATENLQDISIKNGGRIKFTNAKPNATRGLNAVSVLLIDEVAFIPEVEEIYKAVMPTMASLGDKGRVIFLSTPNTQNDFYFNKLNSNNGDINILDVCRDIRNGILPPEYHFIDSKKVCKYFLHYKVHPLYGSQDNYLESLADTYQMTKSAIEQEFNLNFDVSDQTVFVASEIRMCAIGEWNDVVNPECVYYFGLDTSLVGEDYTVLTIVEYDLKTNKYQLVNWYRDRKKSHQINIFKISELIERYHPEKVSIEINSAGQLYFEQLSEAHLDIQFEAIRTSASSKPVMIANLKLLIEQERLTLPNDNAVISEFLSFVKNGENKLEAMTGKHDDIVMSLAISLAKVSN